MCNFCEKESTLLEKEDLISEISFGWGDIKINRSECFEYNLNLFIDRGYLRLVNPDDSDCLDHGNKIKIHFCPMCGEKLL